MDSPHLSPLAQALAASSKLKIDALREAVRNGTYRVSAAELSKAIIDSHLIDSPLKT